MTNKIIISLGTNKGQRVKNLKKAVDLIKKKNIKLEKQSSIFESEPWGIKEQPNFLNQVIELKSDLKPDKLLECFFEIEKKMGRKRIQKWGERIIDIDILYYNDLIINNPQLKIPHPYIEERNFVLTPLNEIVPHWQHPVSGKKQSQLLEECNDPLTVKKFMDV